MSTTLVFAVVALLGHVEAIQPVSSLEECKAGLRSILEETLIRQPKLDIHAYCVPKDVYDQALKLAVGPDGPVAPNTDQYKEAEKLVTQEKYEVK